MFHETAVSSGRDNLKLEYIAFANNSRRRIPVWEHPLDLKNLTKVRLVESQLVAAHDKIALIESCIEALGSHLEESGGYGVRSTYRKGCISILILDIVEFEHRHLDGVHVVVICWHRESSCAELVHSCDYAAADISLWSGNCGSRGCFFLCHFFMV